MSPVEAKSYGLIDSIIGGDDATFKIEGDTRKFPKVGGGARVWLHRFWVCVVSLGRRRADAGLLPTACLF